jgi:uncharacterized protein
MKVQPDTAIGVNVITRYDGPRLWVGSTLFEHSVIVPWQGAVQRWNATVPTGLTALHFEQALALRPEVVIFGSGARLRFVSPALYSSLIERGIGVETMDTPAACRTYNVLASEGRSVVAALLVGAG